MSSIKLQSELSYLASLFNKDIYLAVKYMLNDFPWKTQVSKAVLKSADGGNLYEWDTSTLNSVLSSQMMEEERGAFIELVEGYKKDKTKAEVNAIASSMFDHYRNTKIADTVTRFSENPQLLLDKLKEIPSTFSGADGVEIYPLGSKPAQELIEDELGDLSRVFPTNFRIVAEATPYKGYLPGQVVMFCSIPGQGKSAAMLQEIALILTDNYTKFHNGDTDKKLKVLWLALGDLMKFDFVTRFTSVVTRENYFNVVANPDKYFTDPVRDLANQLHLVTIPSKKITTQEIVDLVNNGENYYDIVVIDYDSNVKTKEETNSYDAGGELYDALSEIARPTNGQLARLVMVASQPKVMYWSSEQIPLEGAGESSRKQHAVDMMITMGKANGPRPCGIMTVAKSRRGTSNAKSPYIMTEYGHIELVETGKYSLFKQSVA